jgi:hypothetical protein
MLRYQNHFWNPSETGCLMLQLVHCPCSLRIWRLSRSFVCGGSWPSPKLCIDATATLLLQTSSQLKEKMVSANTASVVLRGALDPEFTSHGHYLWSNMTCLPLRDGLVSFKWLLHAVSFHVLQPNSYTWVYWKFQGIWTDCYLTGKLLFTGISGQGNWNDSDVMKSHIWLISD